MIKIKLIIVLVGFLYCSLIFGQVSVYDCQPQASIVTQNQIYVPDPFFYQRCIVFEEGQDYVYDENSQYPYADIHIKAGKSICIEPGFRAGEFSASAQGTGSFLMEIDPVEVSPFDVAVMNYDDLEGVLRNDRFELGVELPSTIQAEVDNFIQDQAGDKINPYLSWDIQVTAEFYLVSDPSQNYVQQGFHYVPYERDEPALPAPQPGFSDVTGDVLLPLLGGWTELNTEYGFRVRFAPPTVGTWVGKVKIKTSNNTIESSDFEFQVIPSSTKSNLQVGGTRRFFYHDGETFVPNGNNLKWPRTTKDWDPDLSLLYGYPPSDPNNPYGTDEFYKAFTPPVRTYRVFREQIEKLADNGGNIFRMIMASNSNEIEFEELGNYYGRQNIAFEMDDILYEAENRDVLIYWNLQLHYSYQTNAYFSKWWDWDENNLSNPFYAGIESGNCYQTISNGGVIPNVATPIDFMKSPEARKYYKERLRYILARWGYSTSIASFELFSEINQIGLVYEPNDANGNGVIEADELFSVNCPYSNAEDHNNAIIPSFCLNLSEDDPMFVTNQKLVRNWQRDMIEYMKDDIGYDRPLYTVNYAGNIGIHDESYGLESVDFMSGNHYNLRTKTGDFSWHFDVSEGLSKDDHYEEKYNKLLFYAETGNSLCGRSVEMDRAQWKLLFTGLSGGLDWDSAENQIENDYSNFDRISQFVNGSIDFNGGRWHPGNTRSIQYSLLDNWKHKPNYEKDMIRKDGRGDLTYLRSGDRSKAMGVITNTTYNYYTEDNPVPITDCDSGALTPPSPNHTKKRIKHTDNKGKLNLRNMKSKKYRIDYYWAHSPNSIIHSHTNWGPSVNLEFDMEASEQEYIMLFKAYVENDGGFKSSDSSPLNVIERESDLIVYPNPTRGKFSIKSSDTFKGELTVIVTDILGRVIYTEENIKTNTIDIDISNEKPGMYLIRVVGADKEWTQSIILQ